MIKNNLSTNGSQAGNRKEGEQFDIGISIRKQETNTRACKHQSGKALIIDINTQKLT